MSVTPRAYGNANAMALLMTAFTEGDRHNRALGYWGAVGSAGAIVGQLLGGVLTTAFGGRAIFLIKSPSASSRSPRLRATSPTAAVRHSHVSTSEAPRCSPPGWLR